MVCWLPQESSIVMKVWDLMTSQSAASARPKRSRKLSCFWPPMTAATWRVRKCLWMAATRWSSEYNQVGKR